MKHKNYKLSPSSFKTVRRLFNFATHLFPKFAALTNVYFLRKTNTFIKSKYSRNRQWSKSIVYFGLWFGVISAFVITYYTYRFLFVFSYLWWVPATLVCALTFSHAYKQRKHVSASFLKFWAGL